MPNYDKAAYAEQMKARTKELTDKLETGMKELYNSDKYKSYLNSMSKLYQYSSKNIMLIHQQKPDATMIASFASWKEKFSRQVKRGETGLYIYAPAKQKEPEKMMMEKLDPDTGARLFDKNGEVIMEEMTPLSALKAPKFVLVPVFDVSQTVGEPIPELVESITGNVANYEAFIDALKDVSPLPIKFEPLPESQDGYCEYGVKIGIRENMSETQTVSAIVHEMTHDRLHDKNKLPENTEPKKKMEKEIEAESISYVVCQHYGIETSPNSFGYLAEYGSRDMSELKASLDIIRKEAGSLITAIDERFNAICQERGIDLTAKEPVKAAEPPVQSEPSFTTENRTENIAGIDFSFQEVVPQKSDKDYVFDFYSKLDEGITVYNRLDDASKERQPVAQISLDRDITIHDKAMPESVVNRLIYESQKVEMHVSMPHDTLNTPPPTDLENDEIDKFAIAYYRSTLDTYRHGIPRDTPEQIEKDIAGIADLVRNGNINGIRESLERQIENSPFPAKVSMLLEQLENISDKQQTAEQPAADIIPEQRENSKIENMVISFYEKHIPDYQPSEKETILADIHGFVVSNDHYGMSAYLQGLTERIANEDAIENAVFDYSDIIEEMKNNDPILQQQRAIEIAEDESNYARYDYSQTRPGEDYFNDDMTGAAEKLPVGYLYFVASNEKIPYFSDSEIIEAYKYELDSLSVMGVLYQDVTDETLQEKLYDVYKGEFGIMPESLTETAETTATQDEPDNIIMPDPAIGVSEMNLYGYTADDMLPLTTERAIELFNQDHTIYMLYDDNTEAMAFDTDEIITFGSDGIFGITRADWENSKEYKIATEYGMKSIFNPEATIESDFINSKEDKYAIYQIKDDAEMRRNYRYEGLDYLKERGWEVNRNNYVIVYTAPLTPSDTLESIHQAINNIKPQDFPGHSPSVSDVIVLNKGGEITSHYIDRFGFAELPAFLGVEKQRDIDFKELPIQPEIPKSKQPIYPYSANIALQNGEIDAFHASRQLNIECGQAIDQAVKDSNYEPNHYKLDTAAKTVIDEYGADRVAWVLAGNVNGSYNDGRFSYSNKEWAKELDTPKPDIYLDSHKTIIDGLINKFREAATVREQPLLAEEPPKNEIPVYKFTGETAYQNGEVDTYRQSYRLNVECGEAIDKAISDSNTELYHYDLKTAVKSVIEEYGADRVAWVLAANINHYYWDGRLSDTNKAWAQDFETPKPDVYLKTHLAILDGFSNRFREAEKEKPSLLNTLNKTEQRIKQQGKTPDTAIDGKEKLKKSNREDI